MPVCGTNAKQKLHNQRKMGSEKKNSDINKSHTSYICPVLPIRPEAFWCTTISTRNEHAEVLFTEFSTWQTIFEDTIFSHFKISVDILELHFIQSPLAAQFHSLTMNEFSNFFWARQFQEGKFDVFSLRFYQSLALSFKSAQHDCDVSPPPHT